jgi:hypothetical protein
VELDHVLIAVPELTAAAGVIEERHGLTSIEGGRHAGWGTANRIVPLGSTYLELIAVVDERAGADSLFGRWVATVARTGARPLGWAVRTDELDEVARRLGLAVGSGSRPTADGDLLSWRLAGVEDAAADPSLPFFLEWGAGARFPGRAPAAHRDPELRMEALRLSGDADRLRAWLGDHDLPVAVEPGTPAISSIVLSGTDGEIELDADGLAG